MSLGSGRQVHSLRTVLGDLGQVDDSTVGQTVVADKDVSFDFAFPVRVNVDGASFAPAVDQVAIVALDQAGVVVAHGAGRGQHGLDELKRGRVLVVVALVGKICQYLVQDLDCHATDAVLRECQLGHIAGYAVDDDRTGLITDALPGFVFAGGVLNHNGRRAIAGAVGVHDGTFGEGDDRGSGYWAEDQLAGVGNDFHW